MPALKQDHFKIKATAWPFYLLQKVKLFHDFIWIDL